MFSNIKGAIFDLDGTLIDSMWIWEEIDNTYLSSKGIPVPENLKNEINHLSYEQTAIYFKNRFKLNESVEDILNTWHQMSYSYYSKNVKLKKGVIEFLEFLKSQNIKIGLATSNSRILLDAALKCTNIAKYFNSITLTAEVNYGKNHPDVYLLAAKKLGISPSECIVFEDIIEAVKGAKAAKMKVVAIYDKAAEYQKEELINTADMYIYNFKELLKN